MTEQETVMKFLDKPFNGLLQYLLANGFRSNGGQTDRAHNLNKVTFIAHNKTKHAKVTVWHMWLDADSFGIAKPGCITDIEYKDLDPKDEATCTV